MTLLDRFRTQPQKHPDPVVRIAHVNDIPLSEREQIASIAKEDDDPRVRKAAVAKLLDPGALGAIARDDADDSVRAAAALMLRDIALDLFEGTTEGDSLEAVDALSDVRSLAQIAKTAGARSWRCVHCRGCRTVIPWDRSHVTPRLKQCAAARSSVFVPTGRKRSPSR
jgi:hypothetical protein